MTALRDYVTEIPNFPKKGILFRDITTVLSDKDGFKMAIDGLIDLKGFILVRKKGKLPRETISESYDLEYGTAEVEMHIDAIQPGQKVVIIDDLIATGGTVEAAIKLVEREGGVVAKVAFVMELAGLEGREKLKGYDVDSLIVYEGA